jgi:hypothetical protein
MRKSQITVLSAFAAVVLAIVIAIVAARIIVARIETGDYQREARRAPESGPAATETLDLSGFDRIDARGNWKITISQGTDWDVAVSSPANVEDELQVRVEGDRLVLEHEGRGWSWFRGFDGGESLTATIVMPALESVNLAGAAKLGLTGFSGTELAINAAGAAEIKGRDGRYEELELIVSGAGNADLSGIVVDDARIVLSGAGDITLNMNGGTLSGTVSGAGKVRYRGTVREESIVVSGFSSVEALD